MSGARTDNDGLGRVEAVLWRRGCHPVRVIELTTDGFTEDFDFDPRGIGPDEAVRFRAEAGPRPTISGRLRLGFRGRDGHRHWIAADPAETAWTLRRVPDCAHDGADPSLGTEGGEVGFFFPDAGDPVAFGAPGQPSLEEILGGECLLPGTSAPVSPEGIYQVEGDDPDLVARNPLHDGGARGLLADRPGLAACLPQSAHVVTGCGMVRVVDIPEGERLRTPDHGWQRVLWVSRPTPGQVLQPVYMGLEQGVPDSPDSAVGRILTLTGRFSNQGARRAAGGG